MSSVEVYNITFQESLWQGLYTESKEPFMALCKLDFIYRYGSKPKLPDKFW